MRLEVKSETPEGWTSSTLGTVAYLVKDKVEPAAMPRDSPYVGLEHVEAHSMKLLSYGRAFEVKSTKTRFTAGDVLYGKLRPYLNKVTRPSFDGICSTDFLVFGESPELDRSYLAYYLNQLWVAERAHHVSTGVELPRVDWKSLGELPIAYPVSKELQRAIVDQIERVGALRISAASHLAVARRNIKNFRQAVLAAACSGRLTEDWRASHTNAESADERLLKHASSNKDLTVNKRRTEPAHGLALLDRPELPKSWSYRHVREFVELKAILDIQDGNHGELYPRRTDFVASGGVPFISAESISDKVELQSAPRLDEDVARRLRIGFAKAEDVILTHNATVGRVAVLERGAPDVVLSTSTTYYRVDRRVLIPDYLALFMRSSFFQRQLVAVMEQTTRNQVPVTKQVELYLALPPVDEQSRIVERALDLLTASTRLRSRIDRSSAHIERSSQAVLAKAFRGELVPANLGPGDGAA